VTLPATVLITDYQQYAPNNARGIETPPLFDTSDAGYPGLPSGTYVYVDATSGTDTTGTGASGAPYATVTKAVTVINAGSTDKYVVLRSSGGESHFRESLPAIGTSAHTLGIVGDVGSKCWFKGSDILTGWTNIPGSGWVWGGTYNPPLTNVSGTPPTDQVFVDGVPLVQSLTANPASGSFYVDTANQLLYLADDPSSKTVEATWRKNLRDSTSAGFARTNMILRGFGVAHYGTDFSADVDGALHISGTGQRIDHVVVAYSSCLGLDVSGTTNAIVDQCVIVNTGAVGMHTYTDSGLSVSRLRVDRANWEQGYNVAPSPTARIAGVKTTASTNAVWDRILVRNCHSNGWWSDVGSTGTTVKNITCEDNYCYGFTVELSDNFLLANALFVRNGNSTLNNRDGFRFSGCSNTEFAHVTSVDNVGAAVGIYEDARTYDTSPSRTGTGWNGTASQTYITQAQAKGDQYNTLCYNNVFCNTAAATKAVHYSTNGRVAPSGGGQLAQDSTFNGAQMFSATPFGTLSCQNHHNVILRTSTSQVQFRWATPTTDFNGTGYGSQTSYTLAQVQALTGSPEASSVAIDDNGAALTKYFPNALTTKNYSWSAVTNIPGTSTSATGTTPSSRVATILGTSGATKYGVYTVPISAPVATNTAPTGVAITAPAASATVLGTITVAAVGVDDHDNPIPSMVLKVDGTTVLTLTPGFGYVGSWDTTTVANGSHSLTVTATDSGGLSTTSSAISVTVANPTPDGNPPVLTFEAGFGFGPWQTVTTWTDITASVKHDAGCTIQRGSSLELDDVQPGTASFTLQDFDRTFDPLNGDSPYAGEFMGRTPLRITATQSSQSFVLFYGYIESWPQSYELSDTVVTIPVVAIDALAILARQGLAAISGLILGDPTFGLLDTTNYFASSTYPRQKTGERVAAVLAAAGVPATMMSVDPGLSYVQADDLTTRDNMSVLDYLRLITKTELGKLYADATGVIRWEQRRYDRANNSQGVSQALFSDQAGAFALTYSGLEVDPGDMRLVRNSVVRSAPGIADQTARDALSIVAYGEIQDSATLLFDTAADAANQAQYLVQRYADPAPRITAMVVKPAAAPTVTYPAILKFELFTRLTVTRTPVGVGAPYTAVVVVTQITHTFDAVDWTTTYQLGTPDLANYWTLDNPTLGLLGAGNRIAY
jgi:hypothetical protein